MINRYVVHSCYEYLGPEGKGVSSWFRIGKFYKTEEEAKESIKQMKKLSDSTDKITKLKHFFEVRLIDITTLSIPTYHFPHKGRPTKEDLERKENYYKNYWKQYE